MQSYKKAKRWDYGEVITPQKLNDMSDALQAFTEQIYNATSEIQDKYDSEGKPLNEKLNDRFSQLASRIQFNSLDAIETMVQDFMQGTISYTQQQPDISPEQQARARRNIRAASSAEVVTYGDQINNTQLDVASLPLSTRQENARRNIDAVGQSEFTNAVAGMVKYTDQTKDTTINDTMRSTARANIGAISATEVNNLVTGVVKYVDQLGNNPQAPLISAAEQAIARKNIGALGADDVSAAVTGVVKYSAQNLNDGERSQARANIGAMASSQGITEISGGNGYLYITKNGRTSTIEIPTGLAFATGEFKENEVDHVYELHLYDKNGDDIEGFEPFILPDATLPFDTFECRQGEDDKYYVYAKKNDEDVPETIFRPFQIIGGGGGGGSTSLISLTNVQRPTRIRNGSDAIFSFTATSSDNTDITASWFVDGTEIKPGPGIAISPMSGTAASGSTFSFNAKGYLKNSNESRVQVRLTSTGEGQKSSTWTVSSSDFSVTWNTAVKPIMLYTTDDPVTVLVDVRAPARTDNIVTIKVGSHTQDLVVTGTKTNVGFTLNSSWFSVGANKVTCNMTSAVDSTERADEISFIVLWGYNATTPILSFANDTMIGAQYDTISIPYCVYTPNQETTTITIKIGDNAAETRTVDQQIQTLTYIPQVPETISVTISATYTAQNGVERTVSSSMTLTVKESEYSLNFVDSATLNYNLNPNGHSNLDSSRETFANLTFSQNFDWINGGFQQDEEGATALVIKKGNRVTLPRSIFMESDDTGKTIDLCFKIVNSDKYDAVAAIDMNNDNSKGLILKANEGALYLNNTLPQVFHYCEQQRIDLSIHIEAPTSQRIITIWLDGIPSYVGPYIQNTLIQSENNMIIGSDNCDIWIYAIRVYKQALVEEDMIQNYISNGPTLLEKIKRYSESNIYGQYVTTTDYYQHKEITSDMLHTAMPNLTIIEIEMSRMTKTKKDPVPAHVRIIDGNEILELQAATGPETGDGCVVKVQGTSSTAYARSSLNLDIDFKKCAGKPKYKLSSNSIPVNYLNVKVNVASSENANNICAVDWYNSHQPFLIEARQANSAIRDTMEGKPCAVFIKNTGPDSWFSSQYLKSGDTTLYAMGDLCNSKKNTQVFGQDNVSEINGQQIHPTKCCIEISGNDTLQQRFLQAGVYDSDRGDWSTFNGYDEHGKALYTVHYEWRMEPSDENLQDCIDKWDETVAWVISTKDNPTKFYNEFSNYFVQDAMLYHFLFVEYFSAYDNVSKNTFYSLDYDERVSERTGWGKYRWSINKAYDWDTLLAYDNDGKSLGDYGLDYGELVDGTSIFDANNTSTARSYFNAVDNPIWANIKKAFGNELSALYINRRGVGTWDSVGIINKWNNYQNQRPHAAMVRDAYVKYIYPYKTNGVILDTDRLGYDDNYLGRLAGSKIYQRQQYLTYQTHYMDGKYGYYNISSSVQFRTNTPNTSNYTVKSYAKTFMTFIKDTQPISSKKVAAGDVVEFSNIVSGNNTTFYITPERLVQFIKPLNTIGITTFAAAGSLKLLEAELGGTTVNTSWNANDGIAITSQILKELSIRNISNFSQALNLSAQVELITLDTRDTNAGNIILASYAPLTSIQLNACTGLTMRNLNKVETFTMQGIQRLARIIVENCNSIVNTGIANYLQQYVTTNTTNLPLRNARFININWSLPNTQLLEKLLLVKGINNNNEDTNTTCIITGTIRIENAAHQLQEVSLIDYNRYKDAWGDNLTIECNIVREYTVNFVDWDNRVIRSFIKREGEIIPYGEIPSGPSRAPDEQFTYTFDSWQGLTPAIWTDGYGVVRDMTIKATYTSVLNNYVVKWYRNNTSEQPLATLNSVPYGSEVTYPNELPTKTDNTYYYLFKGWDKSTGFITGNTNVIAQWEISAKNWIGDATNGYTIRLPSGNKIIPSDRGNSLTGLNFNAADVYALSQMDNTQQIMTDLNALNDHITITLGHECDYNNPNNSSQLQPGQVRSKNLINKSMDLTQAIDPIEINDNIFLDHKSFTLLLDFSASRAFYGEDNLIPSLARYVYIDPETNKQYGFQLAVGRGNTTSTSDYRQLRWITWNGDTTGVTRYISYTEHNEIVIRYNAFTQTLALFVRGKEPSTSSGDRILYPGDASLVQKYEVTIPDWNNGNTLYINGYKSNGQPVARIFTYLRRLKLWEGVLSDEDCKKLAKYPRWKTQFTYTGYGLYDNNREGAIKTKLSFMSDNALQWCYTGFYSSYYDFSISLGSLRTIYNDYFKNAFPIQWQAIFDPIENAFYPSSNQYDISKMYTYSQLRYDTTGSDPYPRYLMFKSPNPQLPSGDATGSNVRRDYLTSMMRAKFTLPRFDRLGQNLYYLVNSSSARTTFVDRYRLTNNPTSALHTGDIIWISSGYNVTDAVQSYAIYMFVEKDDYERLRSEYYIGASVIAADIVNYNGYFIHAVGNSIFGELYPSSYYAYGVDDEGYLSTSSTSTPTTTIYIQRLSTIGFSVGTYNLSTT